MEVNTTAPGPAGQGYTPEGARLTAEVYLAGGMPSAWLRARAASGGTVDRVMIANAMDALLAGGFDPAARMREIERAFGGAR